MILLPYSNNYNEKATLATTTKRPEPLGLSYYIAFNEGKGTTAKVTNGGGQGPVTLMRGASWDVGSHGAALKLDGKTNYARAPAINGNPGFKHFSVCIWAKFASTNSGGTRQYMIDSSNHRYFLLVDQDNNGKSVKVW